MKRLSRFFAYAVTIFVSMSSLLHANAAGHTQAAALDPALSASVGHDGNGRWFAVLENSQIRVRYGASVNTDGTVETPIVDLIIKSVNEDLVGSQPGHLLDAIAYRRDMTSATVTYDGTDRKTVHLVWTDVLYNRNDVEDVSIYPNGTYIQIDYLAYGINVVDIGNSTGSYEFYGNSCWLSCGNPRGYVLHEDSYYNRYPGDGINDPANAGSLNYNGYFIGGLYRSSNGRGFARVMPINATNIVKLLFNQGFEWYDYFGQTHQPFTGYLYVVTGGVNEIITVGQQLADQSGPPPTAGPTATRTRTSTPGSSTATPTRTRTPTSTSVAPTVTSTPTRTSPPLVTPTRTATSTQTSTSTPVVPVTGGNSLFLPLVAQNFALRPDLVGTFSLTPNQSTFTPGQPVLITAVITNLGLAPASNFWVDFYLNPSPPPTAGNQVWDTHCSLNPCYGIAWKVAGPLNPGQSITLTSAPGSYYSDNTIWPGSFAPGTTDLYLYVDTFSDDGSPNAAVLESNETNNGAEQHGLTASGAGLSADDTSRRPEDLPTR